MNVRPCILIPCYEHGYALPRLMDEVRGLGLPVIVVNDGSRDESATIIDALARGNAQVVAVHRAVNGGKGAAIRDGLAKADELGFTHAVCLDSDGQHASGDIPRFLDAARQAPSAIILGAPKFGPEAPWLRRVGREFSNVAVAAATASLKARDVLCGFRVYPVQGLREAVTLSEISPGMGFDVEVVVRAIWAGLPIVNVPTTVVYPEQGVSHYRCWRDTLTLLRLEARLIARGLVMLPGRALRSAGGACAETCRHWSQIPERGSLAGLKFLLLVFELLGRRVLMAILAPVMAYMFLFAGTARRAAVDFQAQLMKLSCERPSRRTAHTRAFWQFWEFGTAVVDKVLSWRSGISRERFVFEGHEEFRAAATSERGAILVGAHVGNPEVIRAFGDTRNVAVNALMFTGGSQKIHRFLEGVNERSFVRVVQVDQVDSSLIFELQARLHRGEIVALLADRVSIKSVDRVCEMPFLGGVAPFPEGPWVLASFLDAPVFTGFCMRERRGGYRVEFRKLADRVELPRASRQERLRNYMAAYVAELEDVVRRYPLQWFNFFPFWSSTEGPQGSHGSDSSDSGDRSNHAAKAMHG